MRKFFTFGILLFLIFLWAQANEDVLRNYSRANLGLHGIEASYELPFSERFVWENSSGIGMGANSNASSAEFHFDFLNPTPSVKSGLKYIYNIDYNKKEGAISPALGLKFGYKLF